MSNKKLPSVFIWWVETCSEFWDYVVDCFAKLKSKVRKIPVWRGLPSSFTENKNGVESAFLGSLLKCPEKKQRKLEALPLCHTFHLHFWVNWCFEAACIYHGCFVNKQASFPWQSFSSFFNQHSHGWWTRELYSTQPEGVKAGKNLSVDLMQYSELLL